MPNKRQISNLPKFKDINSTTLNKSLIRDCLEKHLNYSVLR